MGGARQTGKWMWAASAVACVCLLCLTLAARRSPYTQAGLPNLRDVLFVGNPIYEGLSKEEAKIEVLRRLPNVKKIDGELVTPVDIDKAGAGAGGGAAPAGAPAAD